MKKFLAVLLTVCLLISIMPASFLISAAAADEKEFLAFDCSKEANIKAIKLDVEKTIVNEGSSFSAKWDPNANKDIYFENPGDLTDYTHLTFWAYGDSEKPAKFIIFLSSENAATDGSDYYSFNAEIRKDGWNQYTFDLSRAGVAREPIGWDKIDYVRFTTDWGGLVNLDGTVVYFDDVVFTNVAPELPTVPTIAPPKLPTGGNNALAAMGDGVGLMIGSEYAYAKKAISTIDVAPTIAPGDRTLVPVRFISEGFGADVSWEEDTRTVGISLDGTDILLTIDSNEISVNGEVSELDVPAQIIEDRTMIPLRAMAESIGKEVFWDPRGLILITVDEIDAATDSALVEAMIEALTTGELPEADSSDFALTDEVLAKAFAQRPVYFNTNTNLGALGQEQAGSHALFYLCLAASMDPDTKSEAGVLASDRALQHIRNLISGGKEPFCANGPYPGHAAITNALVMAKNTPTVWDQLSADEINKVDLIMKSFAISSNWGFSDANNYVTGLDLIGNFNKSWNPNFRAAGLLPILNAVMYFGDADTVNEIFTSFNYTNYIKELKAAGLTNISNTWEKTGKSAMEKGGSVSLIQGGTGGTGSGVKKEFTYLNMPLSDVEGIFADLVKYSYDPIVTSSEGTKGTAAYAYIITEGAVSPFEGMPGMMMEFKSIDAEGMRSDANYCVMTASVVIPFLYNLKTLRDWESEELMSLIYVGHEDLIFKLENGYHSYSRGNGRDDWEFGDGGGWHMYKDIWRRVILGIDEDTPILIDIHATPTLPPLEDVIPDKGVTEPPATAMHPQPYIFRYPDDSVYDLGKTYKDTIVTEFDLTFSPDIDEDFNSVISYAGKGDTGLTYQQYNILIQFASGTINVRNGGAYVNSKVQIAPNYKYHFRTEIDMKAKTYSVWVTPTYPTAGAEVQIAENFKFREGGNDINTLGTIGLTSEVEYGTLWVENHTTNGDLLVLKPKK